MSGLPESPMPIRSGASRRPGPPTADMTCRHPYDDVGLPCRKTIGAPAPTSRWNIVESRTLLYVTIIPFVALFGASDVEARHPVHRDLDHDAPWRVRRQGPVAPGVAAHSLGHPTAVVG